VPEGTAVDRWSHSGAYAATRSSAKGVRALRRLRATLSPEILLAGGDEWFLGSAADRLGLECSDVVLTIGTSGPTQKVVARLLDEQARVVAVAKIGQRSAAVRRVEHEAAILQSLSGMCVPAVVGTEAVGDRFALFMSHVEGSQPPAERWPSRLAETFLAEMPQSLMVAIGDHPLIGAIGGLERLSEGCAEQLSKRSWVQTTVHGDFAPWNMLIEEGTGKLFVLDWEHARLEGLPYLDGVFYALQVGYLLSGDSPRSALEALGSHGAGLLAELSRPDRFAVAEVAARFVLSERAADGVRPETDECVWWDSVRKAAAESLAVGGA
jgi:hypothetical protein